MLISELLDLVTMAVIAHALESECLHAQTFEDSSLTCRFLQK